MKNMESIDIYRLKKDFSESIDDCEKDSENHEKEIVELIQLLGSRESKTRLNAAREIAKLKEVALRHLIANLKYGDEYEREGTILALAEIGKESIEILINLLEDEDEKVRAGAVLAMGLVGGEEAIKYIINSLKDESNLVRFVASKSLSSLEIESFEQLIQALESEDWRVRYGVSRALEEAGERAIKPLLSTMLKGSDAQRVLAKSILHEIAKKSPECFLDMIKDSELRIPALEILLGLDTEYLFEYLTNLLHHEDHKIREAAIVLVSMIKDKIESKRLSKVLMSALDDESWFVRLVAAETLAKKPGKVGKKEINQLKKLLEDKEIIRKSVMELFEDLS